VNMYAFLNFGPSVKQVLASQGVALWPFVGLAAVFGSLVFLALDNGSGSCIGLSGVTLALLAFDSMVYPSKELRMIVSFIPIHLPAYYLFIGLLGFSVAGVMGLVGGRSNVAHSTHLGGLVFGRLFYEAYRRGYVRMWSYRARNAFNKLRGRN
jgi:membrane associated rhomboid family serine protease